MSVITIESAIGRADDYISQGSVEEAMLELHDSIRHNRNKQNYQGLESLMLRIMEYCSRYLNLFYLKEDLGHFRNLCQHSNMTLLEKILKQLKKKADELATDLEGRENQQELKEFMAEQPIELAEQ